MELNIKNFHGTSSNFLAPAVASTFGTSTSSDNSNNGTEAVEEVNSPNFCELSETEKPQPRVTKKHKQQDDFQAKMLQVLEQQINSEVNDDEVDLAMMAMAKKIKLSLDPDDGAEVIDEMQQLLLRYIRSKKQGNIQNVQPGPPASMALTSQMPTMPQLQRNLEIQYDNNNSHYNM